MDDTRLAEFDRTFRLLMLAVMRGDRLAITTLKSRLVRLYREA